MSPVIWYGDKNISKDLIKNSFKVYGLSNKLGVCKDNLIKVLVTNYIDDVDEKYIIMI